jgi:hypothetical protein
MADEIRGKSLMFRFLDGVEWLGNKLPHPFWLFCILILMVALLSEVLERTGASAVKPETQILKTEENGQRVDGQAFRVDSGFTSFDINMENASRSSRLNNIYVEIRSGGELLYEDNIDRAQLQAFPVNGSASPSWNRMATTASSSSIALRRSGRDPSCHEKD